MELKALFSYELCSVPPSLIDEQGCLRKGSKSVLVQCLGVLKETPPTAEVVIVDVSQLFYHIAWPHGGNAATLAESPRLYLSRYESQRILVFDRYQECTAKDHE